MKLKLKPISEQVIVITGASSGIGLCTARLAVENGARVVVAARSEEALDKLEQELNSNGQKRAVHVAADVTKPEDVHRVAQAAINAFGGFDTWVNDAGTSVYGLLREVPVEDERALFEVNLWGTIYGMKEAVKHLSSKGGALINVGSEVSDHSLPLQGAYAASKHAIKAYTDSFRMELENAKIPISVTLIKPTGIATPFFEHAKNYMDKEPSAPPPMYAPELVAQAILHCAETPTRDFLVGDSAVMNSALGRFAPKLNDKVMGAFGFSGQKSDRAGKSDHHQALERPSGTLKERGDYPDRSIMESSLNTKLGLHPRWTWAAATLAGVLIATAARKR